MRTFNFPRKEALEAEDVLLVDGPGGTRIIKASDAIPSNSDSIEIVNDFTTGGADKAASAETVKTLNTNSATKTELAAAVMSGIADKSIAPEKTTFLDETSKNKNIFDPGVVALGKQLDANGLLVNSFQSSYNTTNFMGLKEAEKLFGSALSASLSLFRCYAFYDINETCIFAKTTDSVGVDNIVAIAGTEYVKVSYSADAVDLQFEIGIGITAYEPYEKAHMINENLIILEKSRYLNTLSSNWFEKIIVTNGTSITFGTSGATGDYTNQLPWCEFVANTLKMTLKNFAVGGSTIAVKESDPLTRSPMITRYQDMTDGDIVVIEAGTNDWQYDWSPLGDMDNRSNYTFYGALHNLCLGLLEKYTGKQILFLTPIKRKQPLYELQTSINANGKTLAEYGGIVKEVCGFYGIPVLDMYNESIINPHIATQATLYIPDLIHPNRAGHEIMAKRIVGYIRGLL